MGFLNDNSALQDRQVKLISPFIPMSLSFYLDQFSGGRSSIFDLKLVENGAILSRSSISKTSLCGDYPKRTSSEPLFGKMSQPSYFFQKPGYNLPSHQTAPALPNHPPAPSQPPPPMSTTLPPPTRIGTPPRPTPPLPSPAFARGRISHQLPLLH